MSDYNNRPIAADLFVMRWCADRFKVEPLPWYHWRRWF